MMNRLNNTTYKLAAAGVVAAAYAALTAALSFISYGPIQFRISEILCVLPFFFPASAPGLFVGCVLANLMSPSGPLDIIFGSLATLLAAFGAAAIGKRAFRRPEGGKPGWGSCIAVCAMPVIFNAPIVGAVLAYTLTEYVFWEGFALYGAQVGLGELAVMFLLALPVMRIILGNKKLMAFFGRLRQS